MAEQRGRRTGQVGRTGRPTPVSRTARASAGAQSLRRRPASSGGPGRRPQKRPVRGRTHVRLRVGFVVVAMVLSVFGARLVQLQGFDPHSYAAAAAAENVVNVVLPAKRGDILDRDGNPLADSADGLMVLADPSQTSKDAPAIAALLSKALKVDYATTLTKLRKQGSRFQYIARRVPATQATAAVTKAGDEGYKGLWTSRDPLREYPNGDTAANLVGFLGTDGPLAGLEMAFDHHLAGIDGHAEYDATSPVSGTRMPLGTNHRVDPINGKPLELTIDRDLQYYVQQTLMKAVQGSRADSGMAVVMDSKTGELLSVADYPTFDARDPAASPKGDRGAASLSNVYEPGSVEKILTISSLIDQGLVSPRTRLVVPSQYVRKGDNPIHDWNPHGTEHLTLAGVIAQSSNIGTVEASDRFPEGVLRKYLVKFGLGQRTGIGLSTESPGLLPSEAAWNPGDENRIDFGQSISVNAVQMTAAINTIANGGVRIDPSLVEGHATNNAGEEVGTDTATRRRVVSAKAARETGEMMERVVDPEAGTASGAAVPGYRVAGKTGTAQEPNPKCGCYKNGTFTVSFGGFAPTDDPRFTVYVVVHNPRNDGGGGSVAGPVFSKIMSFALRRYGVPPTGTHPSTLPTTW